MLRLGLVRPEVLSWTPRVMVLHGFLSDAECDHLVALARAGHMAPSTVLDAAGNAVPDTWRNSSNYFLSEQEEEDERVQDVLSRMSHFAQIPVADNGEAMQVLRYDSGQFYREHEDIIYGEGNVCRGQRAATILMYLSAGVEGGETLFTKAGGPGGSTAPCGGLQVPGLSVKPEKGKAVLFWNISLRGELDLNSTHAGCPVLRGEKWSAT
eukprot:jgi/Mesen1/8461/ME000476S07998